MKPSMGFHVCMFFFSILLCSPGLKCVTLQKMDKREAVHVLEDSPLNKEREERRKGNTRSLENNASTSLQVVWAAVSEDPHGTSAVPSETSLNSTFAISSEAKHHGRLPNEDVIRSKSSDVYSPTVSMMAVDTENASLQGLDKISIGKEMLTTASTSHSVLEVEVFSGTPSRTVQETSTEEEPGFTRPLYTPFFTVIGNEEKEEGGISSKPSSIPQFNTEEMLTANPRTRFFKAVYGHSTTSLLQIGQKSTTENAVLLSSVMSPEELSTVSVKPLSTEAYLSLNTEIHDMTKDRVIASNVSDDTTLNEEWDDTKITSGQIKHIERGHTTQIYHVSALSADQASDGTAMPLLGPTNTTTVETEDHSNTGLADSLQVNMQVGELQTVEDTTALLGDARVTPQSTLLVELDEKISLDLPDTVVPVTDAKLDMQDPTAVTFTDPSEETAEASQESTVTMTSVHLSAQETAEESGLMVPQGKATSETQTTSSISQQWKKPESIAAATSHTTSPSSFVQTPEGSSMVPVQDVLSAVEAATSPAGIKRWTEEMDSVTTATSVSSENTAVAPSLRRTSTTIAYGLEKQESEEGDEEEEDEEEDDEEDEDEEDDEDKDTDSTDESIEADAEVPVITLPGLLSRESLGDGRNPTQLEGLGYHVPDVLAWEHQNQGLVRSWMEKLKDKAGYMSGMLVPVAVGIAGAFFILGALYSIKILNRRRRNGYKRHKKKQREFNSMQDRVMLLADSSEDEF